ncbi:hypothetical protein SKAU_G00061070, partial [Synaphobranchus kaupii]
MVSTDYTGVELRASLFSSEDIEERIQRKTGYRMSREEEDILTNIKEEEDDREVQKEEIKRVFVKDEEAKESCKREGVRDEPDQKPQTDREPISNEDCIKQEFTSLQPRVPDHKHEPSIGPPDIFPWKQIQEEE